MKNRFSKVFFVIVALLAVCLVAVACNPEEQNDPTDPVKYTVTYAGGTDTTGTAPTGGEYAEGAKFNLPDAGTLAKSNHTFGGWSYDGTTYATGAEFTMPKSDVEFTAVWNPTSATTYTVTYNINGATGTAPTESAKAEGAKFNVANVGNLGKENYTFGGWSYDGHTYVGGAEFTMPASNVELVAVWNLVQHTVTFDPNNEQATWTATVEHGQTVAKPAQDPTHSAGKIFRYWTNNGVEFNFNTQITDDIEITAEYNWKVTYDTNGATGSIAPVWVKVWVQPISLPEATGLSNPGKTFVGWSDGHTTYSAGDSFTGTGNHTLHAVWVDTTTTYQVTVYKTNPGSDDSDISGEIPTISNKSAGEMFSIPANTFTRPHYTLSKWRVEKFGTDSTGAAEWTEVARYNADEQIEMPAGMTRIVAVWTVAKITITFDANGGTGTMADVTSNNYNSNYTSFSSWAQCRFTAPVDKEFAGWSTSPTGAVLENGTKLAEPLVSADNRITLYAIWQNKEKPAYTNPVIAMEGKWTVTGHEIQVVANEGVTSDGEVQGYAVLDGIAYEIIALEGSVYISSLDGIYGFNYMYIDNSSLIIAEYSASTEAYEPVITFDTKASLSKASIMSFVGKWDTEITGSLGGKVKQAWNITESYALMGTSQEYAIKVVGEYLVMTKSATDDSNYLYVIKVDGETLIGKYVAPEKDPENVTFTKSQEGVVTYTVTYSIGTGATGTVPTETNKAEGAKFTLASATGLSNGTLAFQGWSDGTRIYDAESEFTMPANNVTLTAVWYDPNTWGEISVFNGALFDQINAEDGKNAIYLFDQPFEVDIYTFVGMFFEIKGTGENARLYAAAVYYKTASGKSAMTYSSSTLQGTDTNSTTIHFHSTAYDYDIQQKGGTIYLTSFAYKSNSPIGLPMVLTKTNKTLNDLRAE